MNVQQGADNAKQAVDAFHTWHSKMTFNPGVPGIDPWLRDALVSLQGTLQTIAKSQQEIARQVDLNTARLDRLERALKR